MFSSKQTPPPSPPPAPEPNDVLEVRFKLSGDTLTKLIVLVLSLALGSAGVGYLQTQSNPAPTSAPAITTETSP